MSLASLSVIDTRECIREQRFGVDIFSLLCARWHNVVVICLPDQRQRALAECSPVGFPNPIRRITLRIPMIGATFMKSLHGASLGHRPTKPALNERNT